MKRQIDNSLIQWMGRKNRKPLLVRGARQVGKTFSISELGKASFKRFVRFDLERQRRIHSIFADDLDPAKLLPQLEAQSAQRIVPNETLLFLDEIQACPRAIMALRYFYEQMPELHVIAAGSLLEFAMEDISFPVGQVEFLWMHPMTFGEFLAARGEGILAEQRPGIKTRTTLPEATHRKLLDQLRQYFIVGGMPEAVKVYLESNSFAEIDRVHTILAEAYQQDFAKYGGRVDKDCLARVFEQIPARIGQQVKYAPLYPEKRVETIKSALRVLERALVIRKVASTSAQGLPLGAGISETVFKYIFADIGLARHMCGLSAASVLEEADILSTFRGSLAEQFVGQELLAERGGSENGKLFYWARAKRNSNAEVDYVIAWNGTILPVEVKSGPAGKLKSMHLFLKEHPHCRSGLVLNSSNVQDAESGKLLFLPLYARLGDD